MSVYVWSSGAEVPRQGPAWTPSPTTPSHTHLTPLLPPLSPFILLPKVLHLNLKVLQGSQGPFPSLVPIVASLQCISLTFPGNSVCVESVLYI